MAAADVQSVSDQLHQLNEAKKAVLSDPQAYYSQIMVGILPLASPNTNVELRRWATNFVAEAFATPTLPGRDKEGMSLLVVGHLRALLENPKEDPYVLRSAIQAAASIYPHAMRWMYVLAPCPRVGCLSVMPAPGLLSSVPDLALAALVCRPSVYARY